MSPEQLVAILTALAAVLGAIGVVLAQVISLKRQVDGRLTQLLELTAVSSHAQGQLEGPAEAISTQRPLRAPPDNDLL